MTKQIYLIAPPKLKNLTEEQKRILKILSGNNELQYDNLLHSTPKYLDKSIKDYKETEPLLVDLSKNEINVFSLNEMKSSDFDEKKYIKSIPILIQWLKKDTISDELKSLIIDVLIDRNISKKLAFDEIIKLYKKNADKNIVNESGFQPLLFITIGNGLIRWVDDASAPAIFELLKDNKLRSDSFLLGSVVNFKREENIKKAIEILKEEFNKPNLNNGRLLLLISALRKLNASETKDLILPFMVYPQNYSRKKKLSLEENYFVTDNDIKIEAKKTIEKFQKLENEQSK